MLTRGVNVRRRLLAGFVSIAMLVGLTSCSVGTASITGHKLRLTAYLSDSAGVFVGNDVGVLGVTVGKITSIVPDGDRVKVAMEVDGDQPIPAGAAAVVVPRSVATDRYVELTPVYRSGPKMHSGAVIPLDRTRTPVEFDEVLASLSNLATGLSGNGKTRKAVKRLLDSQARALAGKGPLIHRSIESLGAATNGISGQRKNATSTLVALDQLTHTLATNQKTVREFVRQVAAATSLLADERQNFRTSLRRVTRMIRVVARFARDNRAEITRTVGGTEHVLHNVLSRRAEVGDLLRVMPLAVQNLHAMLRPDNRLLVRLDITSLLPILGPLLGDLCKALPADPCTAIGLDPAGLKDLLGNLLGLEGKK